MSDVMRSGKLFLTFHMIYDFNREGLRIAAGHESVGGASYCRLKRVGEGARCTAVDPVG